MTPPPASPPPPHPPGSTPPPSSGSAQPDDVPTPPRHDPQTEAIRLKERIYAVITMVAVVVALTEDNTISASEATWTIVGTALGVWLATLVADQQAHRVVRHRLARGNDLRVMLYTSFPLLLSAVSPLIFTAVAGLGLLSLQTALLSAVFVELAGLFAWGVLGGLRLGGGVLAALVAGAADLVIGVLIVAIKVASGH